MILKVKEKNGNETDYYLNDNKTNVSICIDDLAKLYTYEINVLNGKSKVFNNREKSTKFIRIKDGGFLYKIEVEGISYDFFKEHDVDDKNYYFVINLSNEYDEYLDDDEQIQGNSEDMYLYLRLSRYRVERIEYNDKKLTFEDIDIQMRSDRDYLVFTVADIFNRYMKTIPSRTEDNFLLMWRNYYELKLNEITSAEDIESSEIDLNEFRNNYDFWTSLSEDGKIYLPIIVKNSTTSLNSTSLIAYKSLHPEINKSKDLLDNKYNVRYKVLNRNRLEEIKQLALENDEYTFNSNVCSLQFEDGDDSEDLFRALLDRNFTLVTIKQNIVGETERIKRIIEGIDSVMNSDVVNKNLAHQIINNELEDQNNFDINEKEFEKLRENYSTLNDEQLLTVYKIIHMDSLLLVQGPPGTGKTEIISTLTKELDKKNMKVLLTSNVAEARKNITDRIKGEKELIVKKYTTIKEDDDKYKYELKNNKLDYIKNQISEKFSFEEDFIFTPEKYNVLVERLNNYKEKLGYITSLNNNKDNKKKEIKNNSKTIEVIDLINSNLEEHQNEIYKLIINDDLENIPNTILGNTIDKFLELFNNTTLPDEVSKITYTKNQERNYKKLIKLEDKVNFLTRYDVSKSKIDGIIDKKILKDYNDLSSFRKMLFKLSNVLSCFSIDKKNKKDLEQIVLENEKNIKKIDYSNSKNEFDSLKDSFKKYLNTLKERYLEKGELLNSDLNQIERQIIEENNNNWGINQKINKLDGFIQAFDTIKAQYPSEEMFYLYLNDLNKIISLSRDKTINLYYLDSMLSDNMFERVFKYDNVANGTILSMSTSQVAKFLKNVDIDFDYIIVDEASKCNINDLIVSLSRTKKMVLIGDYLQLDPFDGEKDVAFISDEQWDKITKSSFSQMIKPVVDNRFKIKNFDYSSSNSIGILKKQYRMSKEIFDLVDNIYKSVPGFELIDGKKEFSNPNLKYHNILTLQCDGVDHIDEDDTSAYNEKECDYIVNIIKLLYENIKNGRIKNINKIGIISFYKRQSTKINNRIQKLKDELKKCNIKIEIGTVDNFQGREFDLVILSCVRTEKMTSFITQIRRWNVSISRAKDKLIVIGNFDKLYNISTGKNIDKNASQSDREQAVVYTNIIPYFYDHKEEFSSGDAFSNIVVDFLMGGAENE